tara:strand:- start:3763 stop:3942 length:180 start_codon:yes stop_codon:yes gene_type:complete
MLKFFKRKTDLENLNEEYHVLLEKAHIQSKKNRKLSDQYYSQAMQIDLKIKKIRDAKTP